MHINIEIDSEGEREVADPLTLVGLEEENLYNKGVA